MAVHEEVLRAALRMCRHRGGWRFRPAEVVRALPHLDPGTIRTHVVSRCCVNAPVNHPHRWDYFTRVGRGLYEIRRPRRRAHRSPLAQKRKISEPSATYGADQAPARDTIHAVVRRSRDWYVAECLEAAVTTQGRTLDEMLANLQEAIGLHLEGSDAAALGFTTAPRISVTYEISSLRSR